MNRMIQGLKNIVDTVTGNKSTVVPPTNPATEPEPVILPASPDVIQNMANLCETALLHVQSFHHVTPCGHVKRALESIAKFRQEFPK